MNRWKASSLHLLLSLVVDSITAIVLQVWYPYGLYRISDLGRMMVVMLVTGVIGGPLLTLLVYKPGKWGLRFDLTVIALVQTGFLIYSVHALWLGRPLFLVGSDVRFNVVFAGQIDAGELAGTSRPAEWRQPRWRGPILVSVPPQKPGRTTEATGIYMTTGRDLDQLPGQYLPIKR